MTGTNVQFPKWKLETQIETWGFFLKERYTLYACIQYVYLSSAIQRLSEDKTWSPIYTFWFLNKFSNPDLTDWICLIISNFPHILLKYIILHDWLLFPWDHDFPDITMLPHIMAMWSWNHTESSLPMELNIFQYSCGFVYRSSIPTITEGFQMHIQ